MPAIEFVIHGEPATVEIHDLVIAGLLPRLWMKPPPGYGFRPLSDMCDYWADRYEERSAAERSCLEAPLAEEGIRLLRELPPSERPLVLAFLTWPMSQAI